MSLLVPYARKGFAYTLYVYLADGLPRQKSIDILQLERQNLLMWSQFSLNSFLAIINPI